MVSSSTYVSRSESEIDEEMQRMSRAATMLRRLHAMMQMTQPLVNPPCPFQKLTGAQWMRLTLDNPQSCHDALRMTREAFFTLHDMLLPYGLTETRECGSVETLGLFVWACAHGAYVRECREVFQRSLDTISRKISLMADVVYKWAHSIIVPYDRSYKQTMVKLLPYAPWFDGCIGAIDGTHIPVEVNSAAKADFINRKSDVTINVCTIVDMHGRWTYVGAGKVGACHDMRILRDCWRDKRYPHPPPGRYYLANTGYAEVDGYLVPFQESRYHLSEFVGVQMCNLHMEEKFNYNHAKLRNVIERRFGTMRERWKMLTGVPYYSSREKQSRIIISYFALENFLWITTHGQGVTYPLSDLHAQPMERQL